MPSRVTDSRRSSAYTCEIFGKSPELSLGFTNRFAYAMYFFSVSCGMGSTASADGSPPTRRP
jgi:hypothetical protein